MATLSLFEPEPPSPPSNVLVFEEHAYRLERDHVWSNRTGGYLCWFTLRADQHMQAWASDLRTGGVYCDELPVSLGSRLLHGRDLTTGKWAKMRLSAKGLTLIK